MQTLERGYADIDIRQDIQKDHTGLNVDLVVGPSSGLQKEQNMSRSHCSTENYRRAEISNVMLEWKSSLYINCIDFESALLLIARIDTPFGKK